ncbi:MAG: hypothetical protein MUF10_10730 [Thermoanaerobaculaceae bacterium]|nr:hypothetical protein [Thermoanaerobaculaceae bacterium]
MTKTKSSTYSPTLCPDEVPRLAMFGQIGNPEDDLARLLEWYEARFLEVTTGARELTGPDPRDPVAFFKRAFAHLSAARELPEYLRERIAESREGGFFLKRLSQKDADELAEVMVGEMAGAYVSGIVLGVLGARIGADPLARVRKGASKGGKARHGGTEGEASRRDRDLYIHERDSLYRKEFKGEPRKQRVVRIMRDCELNGWHVTESSVLSILGSKKRQRPEVQNPG